MLQSGVKNIEFSEILSFVQRGDAPNTYELFWKDAQRLHRFSHVDLTFSLYPLNTDIDASDFQLFPYEEYVADIAAGRRSSYAELDINAGKAFGSFLAVMIAGLFLLFRPIELISLQSIIGVIGAYAIGKEIWRDLDRMLVNLTKNWHLRWEEPQYHYARQDFETLQPYWERARELRYKVHTVLAKRIDFIAHSNSKTLELEFNRKDLASQVADVRILSTEFSPLQFRDQLENNFLLTCTIEFYTRILIGRRITRVTQAINKADIGAMLAPEQWQQNVAIVEHGWQLGRLILLFGKKVERVSIYSQT